MKIKYVCPINDASGYAEASRMNVLGLLSAGVEVTIGDASFEGHSADLGEDWAKIAPLINKPLNYDTVVVHLTPNNYPRFMEEGKRMIGITVWETSKIAEDWVDPCNAMSQIIVPCRQNVDAFVSAGVTVPIKMVPHAITVPDIEPAEIAGTEGLYKFYSIFQWTGRKNPLGLLKAYYSEFSMSDPVCLVLKTYLDFMQPMQEQEQEIASAIMSVKQMCGLRQAPRVVLIVERMKKEDLFALHGGCDCFVLPHKGEGFGIPIAEAMALGKPVIATTFGGPKDFLNKRNGFPIDYTLTPVYGMSWIPQYTVKQWWAEPDLKQVAMSMRRAFSDQSYSVELGKQAAEDMKEYSIGKVGKQLAEVLCP